MSEIGWIKLYRQIRESSIWDDDEPFDRRSAWIDLLMMVNHEDKRILFNGKMITVKAGQKITSVRKLSDRWKWSKDKTLRFLMLLESENMITKKSDYKRTLLTIVNYGKFQGSCDTDKDSDKDTHKDTDKDTHKAQTRNIRNKEIKKKNIYGANQNILLSDDELSKLKEHFPNDYLKRIDDLSFYISSKGVKYSSHYMTILSWARKDESKKITQADKYQHQQLMKQDYDMQELEKKLIKN